MSSKKTKLRGLTLALGFVIAASAWAATPATEEVCSRAESLCSAGHYWEAIPLFDQALDLDLKCARAYHGRGNCYSELGKLDQAIGDYNKWIQLDPADPRAYHNRGMCYQKQSLFPQAIKDFDQAIKLNPKYVKALFNRAECLEAMGDKPRALAGYEESLKYCGSDAGATRKVQARIEKIKSGRGAD